jgi:hypothetical protein
MESASFGVNSEEINMSHEVFSSIIQAAFRRGFESSEYVPSFGQEALRMALLNAEEASRTAALAEQMEGLIEKMTTMEKEMNKLSAPTKKRRK